MKLVIMQLSSCCCHYRPLSFNCYIEHTNFLVKSKYDFSKIYGVKVSENVIIFYMLSFMYMRPLGRPMRRREDNIRKDLRKVRWRRGLE